MTTTRSRNVLRHDPKKLVDCIISGRGLEGLYRVFRGSTNILKLLRWEPNWFILVQVIKVEDTLVLSAGCVLVRASQ